MLELMVRLVASLAVVVGLMLLLARFVQKRYVARSGAPVQVVHRQPLSRSSSVAVVTVGSRVLVLGTTDHQVTLLTELDPEELELEVEEEVEADVEDGFEGDTTPDAGDAPPVPAPTGAVRPVAAARSALRTAKVPATGSAVPADTGALAGSLLSAQTWRQAIAAATGKAS